MSIKEYKENIIETVKQMELEHGIDVREIRIFVNKSNGLPPEYDVEITM